MNLPITPHCRLDTQCIVINIALYQHCHNTHISRHNRPSPKQSCNTVAHDGLLKNHLWQTSVWLYAYEIRATFVQQFTRCVCVKHTCTGNDPFAGSPTKTLLRLLLLLNEQVWASSRAMCSCRNSQHRPVRRPH